LFLCGACAGTGPAPDLPQVTLGPVFAEVGESSALVWGRGGRGGRLHAVVREVGSDRVFERSVPVFRADDWTGRIELHGLRPDTLHRVTLRLLSQGVDGERAGPSVEGSFRTAPPAHEPAAVRLAFGGDLAGQNVCRDAREGFPIFRAVAAAEPQIFVGLGDMIYADGICAPVGRYGNAQIPGAFPPSAYVADFWAHWRYSREDPAFRDLLASTAYVAVWDDHEVVNDFGPADDTRADPPYREGEHLMPLGLAAFLDYNPLPGSGERLYRSLRWGRHLELFVLDTRQYRDPASEPDEGGKSLLGAEQRDWLVEALARSDATWKVVVSSVPISVPTGRPQRRDGWANYRQDGGYESELLGILRAVRDRGVADTVWLTTDVHFAAVFRYRPFEDSQFRLHEVITGPLNAGLFRNERADETLRGERLFIYGPEDQAGVTTWDEARRFFNFGLLEIDAGGALNVRIVDVDGQVVYELPLAPAD
jgi:alkaline phosphatase D